MISRRRSEELFERASRVIPGGVNSPVRAFRGVGGTPLFIARAEGAYIYDADGNGYIDYVGSWGPMILGHACPVVLQALSEALGEGTSYGAPTDREVELAELICQLVPNIEMVRMVSSGTEATMSALRLARGFTSRERIIKFDGCYHGHGDSLLVQAGSGVATLGIPGSPGVPPAIASLTTSVEYNDLNALRKTIEELGSQTIAAVIIEPVIGNAGLIQPEPGFLEGVRGICTEIGALLIFDEVMTGFRVSLGGAQERFGIKPDLTTLGKIIGAGLPVGAFGGRREIMEHLAPQGPVYQAGTLSGNPLAMTAGLVLLRELVQRDPYQQLEMQTEKLCRGFREIAARRDVPLEISHVGSMFGFFFSETPVRNFTQAKTCNVERFKRFFHAMLDRGVYLAPSAFEAGFVSTSHSSEIIDETLTRIDDALQQSV